MELSRCDFTIDVEHGCVGVRRERSGGWGEVAISKSGGSNDLFFFLEWGRVGSGDLL